MQSLLKRNDIRNITPPYDQYNQVNAWGLYSSVDIYKCAPDIIRDEEMIRQYVIQLCDLLKMNRYGETRVVHFDQGFEFLGFKFYRKYTRPREKSLQNFKDKVRNATRRQQGNNLNFVIGNLNPIVRGWGNYYKKSNIKALFRDLDRWIRMRLRAFIEKKKAISHQNRRIPNKWLEKQGLVSLSSLIT